MRPRQKLLLKVSFATVALLATSACATAGRVRTVDSSCLAFSPGTYANAKAGQEHADDPGNRYDTPETVLWVAAFNRSWRAICEAAK